MKKYFSTLALFLTLSLQADDILQTDQAKNNGLLGQSYINASLGSVYYGNAETRSFVDYSFHAQLQGSYKITNNISLGLSISSSQLQVSHTDPYDTWTIKSEFLRIGVSALYHFLPQRRIDPFVSVDVGTNFSNYTSESTDEYIMNNYNNNDTYTNFALETGAEFDLSDSIFLTPSIIYTYTDRENSNSLTFFYLTMDIKLTDMIFVDAKVGTEFELIKDTDDDIFYTLGVTAQF